MLHTFLLKKTRCTAITFCQKKHLKNVKQSAISDHLLTCGCNINFNDFTILSKASNDFNLLIQESLLIAHDKLFFKKINFFPLEVFE